MKLLLLLVSIAIILTLMNLLMLFEFTTHCKAVASDISAIKQVLNEWEVIE